MRSADHGRVLRRTRWRYRCRHGISGCEGFSPPWIRVFRIMVAPWAHHAATGHHGRVIRKRYGHVVVVAGIIRPGPFGLETPEVRQLAFLDHRLKVNGTQPVDADLYKVLAVLAPRMRPATRAMPPTSRLRRMICGGLSRKHKRTRSYPWWKCGGELLGMLRRAGRRVPRSRFRQVQGETTLKIREIPLSSNPQFRKLLFAMLGPRSFWLPRIVK